MVDLFKAMYNFFFTASVSIWTKILAAVGTILILWMVDGILGFTGFYFTKQKVETIKQIQTLLNDTSLDGATRIELNKELQTTVNRQSFQSQVYFLFAKTTSFSKPYARNSKNNEVNIIERYNIGWLILSSVGLYIIGILASFMKSENRKVQGITRKQRIKSSVYSISFLILGLILWAGLINGLPILFGLHKYVSNFIYQLLTIAVVYLIIGLTKLSNKNRKIKST